jgi:tRNA(fMet)-specific endonuclease VapC
MSGSLFMLDTNTSSYLMRSQDKGIQSRLKKQGVGGVCISAITEAELLFGLLNNPTAVNLGRLVHEFLSRVDCLPWGSDAAHSYAELRAHSKAQGLSLSNMDMLIAAHSVAVGATLISNDKAFSHFSEWIELDNWTTYL